jgi:hypothetical protein
MTDNEPDKAKADNPKKAGAAQARRQDETPAE